MKQSFTMNNLVRFLYKEGSAAENRELAQQLNGDPVLREDFRVLQTAKRQLPRVTFMPSRRALQNVLDYSRETAVETSC